MIIARSRRTSDHPSGFKTCIGEIGLIFIMRSCLCDSNCPYAGSFLVDQTRKYDKCRQGIQNTYIYVKCDYFADNTF